MPTQRPGFMTRAGFLSSYSHYDATSPILRGAFITMYMLGVDPGPPHPGRDHDARRRRRLHDAARDGSTR